MAQQLDDGSASEMESLLHKSGIWQLNSYGWVNADDPDPEFIGHAMWQTDQPLDDLLFGTQSEGETKPQPPEWQRLLALAGADFGGLMQAARMSIGLFLGKSKTSRGPVFDADDLLDLHWMSSVVYLSTASDRLRALFIAAAFRKSGKDYAKGEYNGQKRSRYTTPFIEAKDALTNSLPEAVEALAKTPALADEICRLRKERNRLIHEIATAMGRRALASLEQRPKSPKPRHRDFLAFQAAIKEYQASHMRQLSETIKQTRLLVKPSRTRE